MFVTSYLVHNEEAVFRLYFDHKKGGREIIHYHKLNFHNIIDLKAHLCVKVSIYLSLMPARYFQQLW